VRSEALGLRRRSRPPPWHGHGACELEPPMTRKPLRAAVDGNEAAARIAYAASEVVAIYPITPASPMGELADAWAAKGKPNVFGTVPEVIEMQSEGGAAGAIHGAIQAGALGTTFTASQGLLLMLPNMFKIAGELTPAVIHVAARAIATHALSIFGDHSDVMAARTTGFAMLCSSSVQEAQDLALVAHAATLRSRVPFLHFFDGFRTSHEMSPIELIDERDIRSMLDEDAIRAHRARGLDPDAPVLRGSAQNPDVFFQAREASNPFHLAVPEIVEAEMAKLGSLTGRTYAPFEYEGAPDAERVIVLMGSARGAAREALARRLAAGEKVGLLVVRLYRPFDRERFLAALPASARSIAVLDRTKEQGAIGEPLFLDVALAARGRRAEVIGGRYGLGSKEVTPKMIEAIFAELGRSDPRSGFTVGITDDVTRASLEWDRSPEVEAAGVRRAVFYGLGSDGTVGATKSTVEILSEEPGLFAQGYFVYDSKKSGAVTVSHLRFARRPIESTYLIQRADFVACHQQGLFDQIDVLAVAEKGATLLLNSPFDARTVFGTLPVEVREQILDKQLRVHVVDAHRIAREAGLKGRINTVMQTCFFALSGVVERDRAIAKVKASVEEKYGRMGSSTVRKNLDAIDRALSGLSEVILPAAAGGGKRRTRRVPEDAPTFVDRVTRMILEGRGDLLPVSAFPADGTFPTDTARFEKRSIAKEIPIWDPTICTQCGLCPLVCPHAAIRSKSYTPVPGSALPAMPWKADPSLAFTIQVAPDDCTGCGVCADVCPAKSKSAVKHKAIDMEPIDAHLGVERERWSAFEGLASRSRASVSLDTVKGSQLVDPLFEFSGACAGCGETPYLQLLTRLFGDRMVVANATGCSSIYGGNLPTTPWSKDTDGRGPAWSNSLFEDNAEFGLGIRLGIDRLEAEAHGLLEALSADLGAARALLGPRPATPADVEAQRARITELARALSAASDPRAARLLQIAKYLVPRSVWIVGGDGWAYDIGFGGLDHVLASGRNVNILVLDTEVYSNTGGQASKATPRGAVAKFASSGKAIGKKDLGMIAMAYGNVYVAQIALGASPNQTIRALVEAESYPGVSLVIAYSTCIAHGIDMTESMAHQKEAAKSGYWPLYRFDPRHDAHPFQLDSAKPTLAFEKFAAKEARFAMLHRSDPERAAMLAAKAQRDIDERWRQYEQLAHLERHPEEVTR
jgi:pyruvate-ferredoxin/flavodoxin oxidoreductase